MTPVSAPISTQVVAINMMPWLALASEDGQDLTPLTFSHLLSLPDPYPLLILSRVEQWFETRPEDMHWIPADLRVLVQDACKQLLRQWKYHQGPDSPTSP